MLTHDNESVCAMHWFVQVTFDQHYLRHRSTSFWYQFLHFRLTYSFTITSSSFDSPLCSSITPSLSHSRLKPTCFTNPTPVPPPHSFTSSSRTAVTDYRYCLDRLFSATRFLVLVFPYFYIHLISPIHGSENTQTHTFLAVY